MLTGILSRGTHIYEHHIPVQNWVPTFLQPIPSFSVGMVPPKLEQPQIVTMKALVAALPSQTSQNPTVCQLFLLKIHQGLISARDISPLYVPLSILVFPWEMQGAVCM